VTDHDSAPRRPQVGVGVLVVVDGTILLGLRRGAHGSGTWSPPGGHLEYGEDPVDCVRREAAEEAGIELGECRFAGVTNDIFEVEGRHYVTLFYTAALASGVPTVLEPTKCEQWRWWAWDDLPDKLFLPLQHLRDSGYTIDQP
jgi:8-oxo-dGTP diphosphatase